MRHQFVLATLVIIGGCNSAPTAAPTSFETSAVPVVADDEGNPPGKLWNTKQSLQEF